MNRASKPRLLFVGPMLSRNPGYLPAQAELLADRLAGDGYAVRLTSSQVNKARRLMDIVWTILRRRGETDIQCLQVFGGLSFIAEDAASWLGRRCGHKIIMVLRGGALPDFAAANPAWVRRVLRRAHAIVAPSGFLANWAQGLGFPTDVIPNIIDLLAYPFRLRREISGKLFWMRSFHEVYNPLLAVRALAGITAALPQAELVMAGQDRGLLEATRALAGELGVLERIRFTGFLDHAGKLAHGGWADLYLNTNRVDNMPVSVVEAGALGLPVVATKVGGIPHLLTDGVDALLTPDDDPAACSAAILRLAEDPHLTEQLSHNGRLLAGRCSWEAVSVAWQGLFESVMRQV